MAIFVLARRGVPTADAPPRVELEPDRFAVVTGRPGIPSVHARANVPIGRRVRLDLADGAESVIARVREAPGLSDRPYVATLEVVSTPSLQGATARFFTRHVAAILPERA